MLLWTPAVAGATGWRGFLELGDAGRWSLTGWLVAQVDLALPHHKERFDACGMRGTAQRKQDHGKETRCETAEHFSRMDIVIAPPRFSLSFSPKGVLQEMFHRRVINSNRKRNPLGTYAVALEQCAHGVSV